MDHISKYTGEQIDEALKRAMDGSVITGAEATTLDAGSAATASVENNVLKIGVPAGKKGDPYTLTDTDKEAIAAAVKASLNTKTLIFTLEDGSTVTEEVYVK